MQPGQIRCHSASTWTGRWSSPIRWSIPRWFALARQKPPAAVAEAAGLADAQGKAALKRHRSRPRPEHWTWRTCPTTEALLAVPGPAARGADAPSISPPPPAPCARRPDRRAPERIFSRRARVRRHAQPGRGQQAGGVPGRGSAQQFSYIGNASARTSPLLQARAANVHRAHGGQPDRGPARRVCGGAGMWRRHAPFPRSGAPRPALVAQGHPPAPVGEERADLSAPAAGPRVAWPAHDGQAGGARRSRFLSFGLCASATYIVNDLLDIEADRRHPAQAPPALCRRATFRRSPASAVCGACSLPCSAVLAAACCRAWWRIGRRTWR